MSVQEKIKIFNQLNIKNPKHYEKNITNKEAESNNPSNEELSKILNDSKKVNIKDGNIIDDNKEKNKNFDKKESIDDQLSLKQKEKPINKEAKKEELTKEKSKNKLPSKQSMDISEKMLEKMKSLELYFKLRNEGWYKSPTETPKSLEKIETFQANNNSSKSIDKPKAIKERVKVENEVMRNLEMEKDPFTFNENNYKDRKYDKDTIELGKKFFRFRYIKNKSKKSGDINEKKEGDSLSQNNHDKERSLRKYNSDFILIIEKSILSFNVKNYKESFEFLLSSGIINNKGEYGEILLVVSGFDKFLIGEFLAKQKFPNDEKQVLNNFIEFINMSEQEIKFIDCLRFLFSRLILPKDANLILEIMDKFSINYFDINKKSSDFVDIFKSSDKIYLLVSTILALNTMFTRKDIKIKNVIKKDEFIKMNSEVSKNFLEKLYDELKKNPIIMSDDYNESMYRKLAPLVKEEETVKLDIKPYKSSNINDENRKSNPNEEKIEENNSNNNINKIGEKVSKDNALEEQTPEEEEEFDELCDEEPKKDLEKKEFSLKTNFQNFTEEDEKILKTPHKFYRITGTNKTSQKEYILSDDKRKLYYDKKQRKYYEIKNMVDAFNGINHGHNSNIKKYLKSNPSEEQFSSNFISLIFSSDKDQIDLMADDLESALLWFKSIKSLIIKYGKKSNKDKSKLYEAAIKRKCQFLWNDLLKKWDIYGKFLIIKLMERNKYIFKEDKQNANSIKNFTYKSILNYLKNIKSKKVDKEKEVDYNEFFTIYYAGLPSNIRNKIWQILIGNPCGIIANTYELIKKKIPNINFNDLEIDIQNNKNYCQDIISNKIINEIISMKDLIFNKESKNTNNELNLLMTKTYNIARVFFIFRPDIPYNKNIISLIFLFLNIFEDEANIFCNIANLICSDFLKIFIGDENEIKNYCSFFSGLLKNYLDKIEKHFSKLEISPQLYIVPWFEELFTRTLSYKILLRVFDLYLINGEIVLYQTSLAILNILEEDLLNVTINDVFKILERFPENVPENDLIGKIRDYSCIKKEFFAWKLENELAAQKSDLFEIILSDK